jgi:hypothetical protein
MSTMDKTLETLKQQNPNIGQHLSTIVSEEMNDLFQAMINHGEDFFRGIAVSEDSYTYVKDDPEAEEVFSEWLEAETLRAIQSRIAILNSKFD